MSEGMIKRYLQRSLLRLFHRWDDVSGRYVDANADGHGSEGDDARRACPRRCWPTLLAALRTTTNTSPIVSDRMRGLRSVLLLQRPTLSTPSSMTAAVVALWS